MLCRHVYSARQRVRIGHGGSDVGEGGFCVAAHPARDDLTDGQRILLLAGALSGAVFAALHASYACARLGDVTITSKIV